MPFFLPIAAALMAAGLSYYAYTYITWGRLTNMNAILFLSSLLTFLIASCRNRYPPYTTGTSLKHAVVRTADCTYAIDA